MAPKEPETELPALSAEDAKRLAEAVRRIDKAMKDLAHAGLKRKAIVVLLADTTDLSKRDINAVLDGLEGLAEQYLDASNTGKTR